MVQVIQKKGSIFGRLGKGLSEGLSETVPKEIERNRLSSGLKQLEQDSDNLSPMQFLTRAASVPGITPQMIQSFGELAKHQGNRNSYQNYADELNSQNPQGQDAQNQIPAANALKNINFANLPTDQNQNNQSSSRQVDRDETGQPQIVNTNPLRDEAIPVPPWTKERKAKEIANLAKKFPNMNHEQINEIVTDNEARDLARPAAEREKDTYLQNVEDAVEKKFIKQLETKLQKSGEGVFKDISGQQLVNLQRGLENELRENPKESVNDVVNKWTNKAVNFAKTKGNLNVLSQEGLLNRIFKPQQALDKLKSYQKSFRDANQLEEFYDILRASKEKNGFGMSNQTASQIAFPRSDKVNNYTKSLNIPSKSMQETSSKIAKKIVDNNILSKDDSILAVVRDLRDKYPYFDQSSFLNYLRENRDNLPLTGRQRQELDIGEGDLTPTWGDMWILRGGFK